MNTAVTNTTIESPDSTKDLGHGPEARQEFPKLTTGSPGKWSVPSPTGTNGVHSDQIPFGNSRECTYETYEIKEIRDIKEPKGTDEAEEREEAEERGETNELEKRATVDKLNPQLSGRIDEAISQYRVTADRDIDRPLFMLANRVRGIEEEFNIHFSVAAAAEIVRRWTASNQDQLENNHDYLTDFLCKLDLVLPEGPSACERP